MKEQASVNSLGEALEDLDRRLDAEAQAYSRMLIADFRGRDWRRSIRSLHDQAFLFSWQTHLQRLNGDLRRSRENQLCTPQPDLPPAWFNGNVEKIEPGRWVLFVSLNPQLPGPEMDGLPRTPDAWWLFWLTHNQDHWYGKFFSRPTLLATINGRDIPLFAFPFLGTRMTHNSNPEVKQLGEWIRSALLEDRWKF